MWAALAGAGLGLGKGVLDQQQEARDRQLAAETQRWSPWTGMKAEPIKKADMLGSVMQGGMTGLAMGQGYDQMQNQEALMQAQTDYYKGHTPPAATEVAQEGSPNFRGPPRPGSTQHVASYRSPWSTYS